MMAQRLRTAWQRASNHVFSMHRRNVNTFRSQPSLELSGAFGDLGTFVPIFVAMVHTNQISAGATLVFSGLANIMTGIVFGIPLPVQPMKAIAAIALQKDLSSSEIFGAGFFVAVAVGLFSTLGLLDWFTRAVPVPIVKGIQCGAGLSLILSAFTGSFRYVLSPTSDSGEQLGLLVATLTILFICSLRQRLPFVLIVIVLSIVVAIFSSFWFGTLYPGFRIWYPGIWVPSGAGFIRGIMSAGLGQLPLTVLNSVLAVVVLAQDLFPDLHAENALPSAGQIGASVTLMNVIALWFGSMPFCHGSGGLAAQYRFGARSGASVMMLGALKLILGLFASNLVAAWCQAFSTSGAAVLGVLIFLAGLELAKMGQNLNSKGARDLWEDSTTEQDDARNSGQISSEHTIKDKIRPVTEEESMRRWTVMIVTIGCLLGAKNDGIGFIAGMALHTAYRVTDWWQARNEGNIRLEEDD